MYNRWVQYWANRYRWAIERRQDLDMEDLLQAASMGEYIAKLKYAPERGTFSTFSAFYIRNEIRDLLGIRNGRLPPAIISLDEPISEESEDTRLDMLEDKTLPDKDEIMQDNERREGVRAAIDRLPDQQREVMRKYYLQGMGSKAIGEAMGLTSPQVLHIVEAARRAMRKDRLLRQLVEVEAPCYIRVGVSTFQSTRTSAVELAYLIYEREKERIQRSINRLQEQDAQEEYCKQEEKVI
jgi:RNA polymerase sigma factor (sigma-70 family)